MIELHDLVVTCYRWFTGLAGGAVLGIVWYLASTGGAWVRTPSTFALDFLRALPVLGLLPFVQLVFGVSEAGKLLLIAWTTSFPIWIALRQSMSADLKELTRLVLVHKPSRSFLIRRLYWPRFFEGLVTGVSISIGLGWLVVVTAEMMGAYTLGPFRGGVGVRLFDFVEIGQYVSAATCLMIFGFLGLTSSAVWHRFAAPGLRSWARLRPWGAIAMEDLL